MRGMNVCYTRTCVQVVTLLTRDKFIFPASILVLLRRSMLHNFMLGRAASFAHLNVGMGTDNISRSLFLPSFL